MSEDKIDVKGKHKHLYIHEEEEEDRRVYRKVLTPDMDVSGEVQEIQDKASELWTDEVKASWATFQAEQEAKREAE